MINIAQVPKAAQPQWPWE